MRGVSAAVAQARAGNGAGELVLRLQPANLGHVKVRVAFDRGVSARFEVSSGEARRLVDGSLADLRAALESRGRGVGKLEVRLAARERPVSDPLGLVSGTPYAEARSDAGSASAAPPQTFQADGRTGAGMDAGGGGGEQMGSFFHDGQPGPEARTDRGKGSTDAPPSSLSLEGADAERSAWISVPGQMFAAGRDEGGALRLVIDAIA
jgi:hypothetical protein